MPVASALIVDMPPLFSINTCAWPILILRGVSQPTPNAPEVPRTAGVCLDISNAHVPRYFHIFMFFALRIFVKNAIYIYIYTAHRSTGNLV